MEEDYIKYVEDQLKKLKDAEKLIEEGHILPFRINKALAEYQKINDMLIAEYQRNKWAEKKLQKRFKLWWDEKFIEARDKLNSDRTKSKYASKSEIESQARVDSKEEYIEWEDVIDEAEAKTRLLLRLLDSWAKEERILVQLSKNMQSEMSALYVMDKPRNQGGARKRRVEPELPSKND